jgi:hypothetical protein
VVFHCAICGRGVDVDDPEIIAEIAELKAEHKNTRTLCAPCYDEFSEERYIVEAWKKAGLIDRDRPN